MPPINLLKIKRTVDERPDARKIFVLSEGTNTEPGFIEKILTNSGYGLGGEYSFIKVEKTGNDRGVTSLEGLIRLANLIIADKRHGFNKRKDKILLLFDLDVYGKGRKMEEIKRLIDANKKHIIFAYTNPAIELFLLLCLSADAYETHIAPKRQKILLNEWVTSKDDKKRRYIADLFFALSGIDSKKGSTNFATLAKNIQHAVNQERMYLQSKLGNPREHLISNLGYVLEHMKERKIDAIEYLLLLDKN